VNTNEAAREMANQTEEVPRLVRAEPQLFVRDIQRACAFYAERLGFEVVFIHGEPPFYGQVARDGVRLNLRHVDQPAIAAEVRAREPDLLAASIVVTNLEQLYLAYQAADVVFYQPLRTEPWGAQTFIVPDLDENLVLFTSELPDDGGR
jgi:catechol 2,3-dioxygenase-like lactoylglutathione lyase family enzyme